jgi:hypothetical protein
MRNSQHCSPVIIDGETCHVLERIEFKERAYSEEWLQNLLFTQPSLIPVNEIEPLFSPLIPLAREMRTTAGPVDVVYVNPAGYLTLVETKLWRNPEARRQVVAQIMDYAAAVSKWSYEELRDAVKRAGGPADLIKLVAGMEENFDRAGFIDAVSKNLARGRMLLLLVGDGIQEGVEQLTDTLSRSPQLGFCLGLVELATYRFGEASKTLVLPRIIARTREVVRAVVEVQIVDGKPKVEVSIPVAKAGRQAGIRHRLTIIDTIERIQAALGSETGQFWNFLSRVEELLVDPESRDASLSLFWYEPNTERRFTFGSIYTDGHVDFRFVMMNYRKAGLDPQIGYDYILAVAGMLPGAMVMEKRSGGEKWGADIELSGKPVQLAEMLAHGDEWLSLIQEFTKRTQEAAAKLDE